MSRARRGDCYRILGLRPSASPSDIYRAYRELVRQYHPDVNPGNSKAEEKFLEVQAAFEMLTGGGPEEVVVAAMAMADQAFEGWDWLVLSRCLKPRDRAARLVAGLCVTAMLVCGLSGFAWLLCGDTLPTAVDGASAMSTSEPPVFGVPEPEPPEFQDLQTKIECSVVQIETDRGLGSGFVLDEAGTIATCFHVVSGRRKATVVFPDGQRVEALDHMAVSELSDVAILWIDTDRKLVPLPLASTLPCVGQAVASFRHSGEAHLGKVSYLAASGRFARRGWEVAALFPHLSEVYPVEPDTWQRKLLEISFSFLEGHYRFGLIGTTVAMYPGWSGGPLVDMRGHVVGMNMGHSGMNVGSSSYCSYAVPVNEVQCVLRNAKERLNCRP